MSAHADDMIDAARHYNRPLLSHSERQAMEIPAMTSIHHDDRACACQNCDWTGEVTECEAIDDIGQRVAAGEPMPCGQCPECHALCQLADEEDDVDYMRSPFGNEITDVVVTTPGLCGILLTEAGAFDYDGTGTQHDYDASEELIRAGQRVFQDDAGNEWLEGELVKPGQPLPAIIASPWDDLDNVRLFLREKLDEAMKVVMDDRKSGNTVPLQESALDIRLIELARLMLEIRLQNPSA